MNTINEIQLKKLMKNIKCEPDNVSYEEIKNV